MVDGKMAFPLSRSIASLLTLTQHQPTTNHQPPPTTQPPAMADVQTNLLSYILTKLHSDVARIESQIHQVHTGQYVSSYLFVFSR